MSTSNAQIQCNSSSTPGTASTRREATGCRSSYSPGSKTVPHSPAAPIMASLSVQYLSGGRAVCTPSSSPSSATLRRRSEFAATPPTTATEDTLSRSAAVPTVAPVLRDTPQQHQEPSLSSPPHSSL